MSQRTLSGVLKTLAIWAALVAPLSAGALSFSNRYRSPRNPERPIRKATRLIVLHTTEAGAKSSLNKLSERGEAHYCIDERGVVHRIVDRNREAFHAGRSMWSGKEECDGYSIGIEVVGHHDKPVTLAQLDAIRELLVILKKEYKLTDVQVVCHSHVAYGAPNKWQKRNHRGRKRCGMLFAMPSVRQRLGLKVKPAFDPDVRAKRLTVGDPYLNNVLYGKVDTMVGKLGRNVAPEPKNGIFSSFFSKKSPERANEPEKENYYEKPEGAVATGRSKRVPPATAVQAETPSPKPKVPFASVRVPAEPRSLKELEDRMKYREASVLGPKASPYKVAGRNWNAATTYYFMRGRIVRGDRMEPKKVPPGTRVFLRK